jgi:mannose-6-phosphate isomerase-like protein (cupin superfamily)
MYSGFVPTEKDVLAQAGGGGSLGGGAKANANAGRWKIIQSQSISSLQDASSVQQQVVVGSTEVSGLDQLSWTTFAAGQTANNQMNPSATTLLTVVNGTGTVWVEGPAGGAVHNISSGTTVMVSPGTLHSVHNTGKIPLVLITVLAKAPTLVSVGPAGSPGRGMNARALAAAKANGAHV